MGVVRCRSGGCSEAATLVAEGVRVVTSKPLECLMRLLSSAGVDLGLRIL